METGAEAVRLLEHSERPRQPTPSALPRRRPGRVGAGARPRWSSRSGAAQADMTIAVFSNRVKQAGTASWSACPGSGIRRATGWCPGAAAERPALPDPRRVRGGPAAGPGIRRGDRAHHRPAPRGACGSPRWRSRWRTGRPAATGGPRCTGPASSPTWPGRWPSGSRGRGPRAGRCPAPKARAADWTEEWQGARTGLREGTSDRATREGGGYSAPGGAKEQGVRQIARWILPVRCRAAAADPAGGAPGPGAGRSPGRARLRRRRPTIPR